MLAEWSVECAAEDPVLVLPWSDPSNPEVRFVDLRENPYDLDRVAEAELHPPLMQALRSLNGNRSPVFTAKCDAWSMDADERAALQLELDPTEEEMPSGFASYIDLLWRDRSIFVSFHQQEQAISRFTRLAAALDHPHAALECVIRPALLDLTTPQEGFAVSLYLKAIAEDQQAAWDRWAAALDAVVLLLRSKEMALGRGARYNQAIAGARASSSIG